MFGQRRNPFLGTDMPASYTTGLGDDIARRSNPYLAGSEPAPRSMPQGMVSPQSMMAPQMEQPKPKGGGLFGKQSALWKVLGTLGDGLTGNPVYGQMQQQERQTLMQQERERQKAEDAQRAQMEERQYDQGEWDRRQQYERDNPKPMQPTEFERLLAASGMSPENQTKTIGQYVQNRANPVMGVPYTDAQGNTGLQYIRPNQQAPQGAPEFAGWPEDNGGPASQAPRNFPVNYDQFKRAIIQQESGGRYGVANGQGSGAMGLGQIMPDTAKALSKRLGIPYRPDLLAGNGQAARQYQDALTDAAVREAWKAGGAGKDPRTSAQYYFGGSDRGKWGPKTKRYGQEVLGRIR